MKIKDIDKIMRILKKESSKFKSPIVTDIGVREKDPYLVLVSCVLSLRTKDETTARASERLFKLAKTPYEMIKLSEKEIEKAIYPVGFYKTKAKNIKGMSNVLINKFNGEVPEDFDELLNLKGVGRKTANIVMVFGFGRGDYIPIDTHCHRIPNRLGWLRTKTPEETEMMLRKMLPKKHWQDFNDLFVRFGQNICVPVSPFCSRCPIKKYCMKKGVGKRR